MTFQGVPWFVAGGEHSPEVARLLAFAATGGGEGVVAAADCKVRPTVVPGTGVRIGPGAVVIPNRKAGAAYQSYMGRNPEDEIVEMTATGSGGARSDLIIVRIDDPQYPGAPPVADPAVGPYVIPDVIEGVPATTTRVQEIAGHEDDTALTLARVTRPASTGTVEAAHITDLRSLSQTRARHEVRIDNPVAPDLQDSEAADGENWPDTAVWTVDVPLWATTARMVATWAQIKIPGGDASGWLWVRGYVGTDVMLTQQVRYNTPNPTGESRGTFVCADEIAVPSALRGKRVTFVLRAQKTGGGLSARITADTGSACSLVMDFIETPV